MPAGPAAAKESSRDEPKETPVAWTQKFVPGQSVTLRLKHTPGQSLLYEGSIKRSQQSAARYDESGEFYLTVLCVEQADGFDQLAIRRTYLDRKRLEVLENGKKIDRILPNTDEIVNLGPSFNLVNKLRCYAFDAQNRPACRTEELLILKNGQQLCGQVVKKEKDKLVFLTGDDTIDILRDNVADQRPVEKPLVCHDESPHYLFPLFSKRAVAPGDEWRFKIPVIIPVEQLAPARVLPTQFNLSLVGRLREVRQGGGAQVAVVDYQFSGVFDSRAAEFRARFPDEFHQMNRTIHSLSGSGSVSVDVEKGRILEKSENFNVVVDDKADIPQPADKPAQHKEQRMEIVSSFQLKLLPPGTRLRNGMAVPDYDVKAEH
ncbi:MAG: hypothetical protein ABSE73_30855 [Planctomycetota bacterium]